MVVVRRVVVARLYSGWLGVWDLMAFPALSARPCPSPFVWLPALPSHGDVAAATVRCSTLCLILRAKSSPMLGPRA